MDPVSTAMIAAITAGVTSGLTDTSKSALSDSYNGLKRLIAGRFAPAAQAVAELENVSDSPSLQNKLATIMAETGAATDPAIVSAAEKVTTLLKANHHPTSITQNVSGHNVAVATHGSTATINIRPDR